MEFQIHFATKFNILLIFLFHILIIIIFCTKNRLFNGYFQIFSFLNRFLGDFESKLPILNVFAIDNPKISFGSLPEILFESSIVCLEKPNILVP